MSDKLTHETPHDETVLDYAGRNVRANFKTPAKDHFSVRARAVLDRAAQEARGFNHEFMGVEHLLLGWALEAAAADPELLKTLQLDVAASRAEIERIIKRGPATVVGEPLLTSEAKLILKSARVEAARGGWKSVESEHLAVAILRVGTLASDILARLQLNVPRTCGLVIERLEARTGQKTKAKDAESRDMLLATGDLFLWLVAAKDSLVRQALLNRNVDPAEIENEVRKLMEENDHV